MSNMEQKIVMKIDMHCDKCISKAPSIAAVAYDVISVAIQGNDRDEIVVIGEGVDTARLVKLLRKKVGYTAIVSVQPAPPPPPEAAPQWPPPIYGYPIYYPIEHPQFQMCEVVYDQYPNNNCSIM